MIDLEIPITIDRHEAQCVLKVVMILDVGPTPIVMTLTVPYVQMEIQAIVYCETQIR